MSPRPRHVLLVARDGPLADALAEALSRRAHSVTVARSAAEALNLPAHEVLVTDEGAGRPAGADEGREPDGLDLLEELQRRGQRPRAVVLTEAPDLATCRRALRLGAVDYLARPFPLEELLRAVEGEHDARRENRPGRWRRSLPATPGAIDRAAREVTAFALRCGLSPSTRARVATACAELVENAVRHAYPETTGAVHLEIDVEPRRLELAVIDEGAGFDAVDVGLEHMSDARDGGLARVSALSEDLRVESGPGGTRALVSFDVFRVLFDGEERFDLSEHDWLAPETTRGLLDVLSSLESDEPLHLSPALAVTVGRLLAGPDPRRVLQTALWS